MSNPSRSAAPAGKCRFVVIINESAVEQLREDAAQCKRTLSSQVEYILEQRYAVTNGNYHDAGRS